MIHGIYSVALWLAAPFIITYHFFRSARRRRPPAFVERFGFVPSGRLAMLEGKSPIWVHAVSVGETIAVKPLLRAMKERFPERQIVLSNGTETGRNVAQTIPEVDLCIYYPFDYQFAAKRLLASIRPAIVLVVETEIWPNFLRTARKMGIPVVMVNGRISDRSFGRYLRLRWFFSRVLGDFSLFCMQTREDARRIEAIGAPAGGIEVTRNLKYDLPVVPLTPLARAELRIEFHIPADCAVFTAGSTHPGEDETVLGAYRRLIDEGRELFLVLVPRHPERVPHVADLLRREGVPFALRSMLAGRTEMFRAGEVLLVDTVGELMGFYALSDLVFVGGSLVPTGGHNILEPASLRVPVLFGPHMSNFREVASLILACGGGRQVRDGNELALSLGELLEDQGERAAMGVKGARLLEENRGSTALHLGIVERFLEGR